MIYAIGDIHGQKAQLDHSLSLITEDGGPEAEVVFLGDYTDRGPDSRAVVETLVAGLDAGRNWHCIRGNHDRLFTNYLRHGILHDAAVKSQIAWLNPRLGGNTTLASYGVGGGEGYITDHPKGAPEDVLGLQVGDVRLSPTEVLEAARAAVPETHLRFLESRPLMHRAGDILFVHAGIRPGVPLADQDTEDLLWIREDFLRDKRDHGVMVVHGHTALEYPRHHGNRINLDGGAGYGRPLYPAVFDSGEAYLLKDSGRELLWPHHDATGA